jgi:hypothetical protein
MGQTTNYTKCSLIIPEDSSNSSIKYTAGPDHVKYLLPMPGELWYKIVTESSN